MGLISRVSSRTYRFTKTIKMADKVKALRVSSLRNESKDALTAKLAELRQELATLKVAKVTAQSASKLGKINVVRKDIAKVLTVINQPRKARALRKRLNKHESSLKSLKTVRREQKTALKNFALKAYFFCKKLIISIEFIVRLRFIN